MTTSDLYQEVRIASGDFGVYHNNVLLDNSYKYVDIIINAALRNALYSFTSYSMSSDGATITPDLSGSTRAAVIYMTAYILIAPEADGGMIKAGDNTVTENPKKSQLSLIIDKLTEYSEDENIPWSTQMSSTWIENTEYLD